MRPSNRTVGGIVMAACLLPVGCAGEPPPIVDASIIAAGELGGDSADRLARGYNLLVTECADCHRAVHPSAHSLGKWDATLPRMLRKAGLGVEDGADIRAYVVAVQAAEQQAAGTSDQR